MNTPDQLTNAAGCLQALFPDEASRPCMRTFQTWKRQRLIPYSKIGRSVYFNPAKVRAALDKRFEVQAR